MSKNDDSAWVVGVPASEALADPGFAEAYRRVVGRLDTRPVPMEPLFEAGDLLYDGPWVAERLAGLADFFADHPDDVLPVTRAVIESGREFDAVTCFRARHRLQELRAWTERLWSQVDVLLLPTTPTTFTRAQLAAEPVAHNRTLGRFTQFTNLLDLAAVAVPAGTTADGRPFGVTLFGPAFAEDRLISAASDLITGGRMTSTIPQDSADRPGRRQPVRLALRRLGQHGARGAGLHRLAGRLLRPRRLRRPHGL